MYHWDKTLIEGLDARDLSIRELDMSRMGSVLTGDRTELRDGPQVHGLFIQHDDLYQAGGHSHIQIGPKLIEPPGECQSNHEVLQGLAARLGAKHPGFDMTAMQIIDATLRASGWPDAATVLRERWIEAYDEKTDKRFANGFLTNDKKFHFAPDWAALGPLHDCMPKLPDHMA